MSGTTTRVNKLAQGEFVVYDSSNTPVLGLAQSAFTILVAYEGADSAVAVTITEVGNGRYLYSFTPNAVGDWYVVIRHATYNARGWDEEFQAVTGGGDADAGSSEAKRRTRWHNPFAVERQKALEQFSIERALIEVNNPAIVIALIEAVDDEID